MSKLVQPDGDDHPEAAGKHLGDADVLLAASRFDGAGYHAGYVVECVLKTILLAEAHPLERSHDLAGLGARAFAAASAAGAVVATHLTPTLLSSDVSAVSAGWRETLRYRPAGVVSKADAEAWVMEARTLFTAIIEPLWLDGVL